MNNNFQNPLQVLKVKSKEAWSGCIEIEEPQDASVRSGCIEIEEPQDASVSWNVYLLEGKIQYINSSIGQQVRLNYLWQKFNLGSQCPQLDKQEASEYVQLCQALANKQLSNSEIKKHLFHFTREALGNVLSIEQTKINLIPARRIKKSIISFSLEQLVAKLEDQIKAWKNSWSLN